MRCANCGCEIPNEEKTRLCDNCRKVILPAIKFMEASTTPSVKRLLSNERNLRNAGVTDSGMDYLYRICELQDRKRQSEQEAKAQSRLAAAYGKPAEPSPAPAEQKEADEPASLPEETEGEDTPKTAPGRALPAAKWALILSGTTAVVWFAAKILTRELAGESLTDSIDVPSLCVSLSSYAGAYVADVMGKVLRERDTEDKE